jgi:hypothetical protein
MKKHTLRSCSSAKYSLFTSLLGMASLELMDSAVSRTWTGKPYSRSRRQTWQTFFNLLHVWQISVFLNLASRPGLHLKTVNGRVQILHSLSKSALVCIQICMHQYLTMVEIGYFWLIKRNWLFLIKHSKIETTIMKFIHAPLQEN